MNADTPQSATSPENGSQRVSDPEYRRWYNRGWRYSGSGSNSVSLDHGDAMNAPDAWYDGYLDYAAGREKWHLANCTGCLEHPRSN